MNTVFVNSENSKRPDPQRLSPNLTDKIDLGKKRQIYFFIKSYHLLFMAKY